MKNEAAAAHRGFWSRAADLYIDGFKNMGSTGRKLWALIIVKLAIIFLVFKLLLFPNPLKEGYDNDADRADAVRESLLDPARK